MMIARIESNEDLGAVLKERREALGVTQEEAEHAIGLTQGHLGKIEHGGKTWGKLVMRMTSTLIWLLEYYGLTLMIVDRETAARLQSPAVERRLRAHLHKPSRTYHPNSQRLIVRLHRLPL